MPQAWGFSERRAQGAWTSVRSGAEYEDDLDGLDGF